MYHHNILLITGVSEQWLFLEEKFNFSDSLRFKEEYVVKKEFWWLVQWVGGYSYNCIESGSVICELAGQFLLCFIYIWLEELLRFKQLETLDMHSSVPAMSSLAKCWKFSGQISVQFSTR